jgi:hypothetical protein
VEHNTAIGRYFDQTERDYETLKTAARKGQLEVLIERD